MIIHAISSITGEVIELTNNVTSPSPEAVVQAFRDFDAKCDPDIEPFEYRMMSFINTDEHSAAFVLDDSQGLIAGIVYFHHV